MRRSVKSDTVSCHSVDAQVTNHAARSRNLKRTLEGTLRGHEPPTALLDAIVHILPTTLIGSFHPHSWKSCL
jgi:hypothetical protein